MLSRISALFDGKLIVPQACVRGERMLSRRHFASGMTIILCLIANGCGQSESRVPVFKVSGTVTQNGKGIQYASVVFHPKVKKEGVRNPSATTNADGKYELTTYEKNDGAPAGEYSVTISQWINDDPNVGPTNRLPGNLSVPETSGFSATVNTAETVVPPFQVP